MRSSSRTETGQRDLEAELKLVTVLFVDIVGSTAVIRDATPETARDFLDRFRADMARVAGRHGGTVASSVGDGMMFLFGVPAAGARQAANACRAGLDILAATRTAREDRPPIEVRLGISTGEVLVKPVRMDFGWHYDASGVPVNIGARMEAMAPPGEIYVEPTTHGLTSGEFLFSALGPQVVRGLERPLEVFRLEGQRSAPDPAVAGNGSAFVGRERELRHLVEHTAETADEGTKVIVVVGEPGIGKSRLLHEFARQSSASNARRPVFCRGYHGFGELFAGIRECVRQCAAPASLSDREHFAAELLAGANGQASDADHAAICNLYEGLFGAEASAETGGKPDLRGLLNKNLAAIRAGFQALVRAQTRHCRPVFILDEFFELDSESKEIFFGLMSGDTACPVTVVLSCRSERISTLLSHDLSGVEILKLGRLSDAEALELIGRLLGTETQDAPDGGTTAVSRAEIVQWGAGNPLFLHEIVKSLGRREESGRSMAQRSGRRAFAGTPVLQSVISERVDKVPADEKQVLRIGAILGEEFPVSVLGRIVERRGLDFAAVESVLAKGLLSTTGAADHQKLRFAHPLFQEVIAASVPRDALASLHRDAFDAFGPGSELSSHASAMAKAYHAREASLWEPAIRWFRTAAALSNERAMNSQAIALIEEALRAATHLEDPAERARTEVDLMIELRNPLYQIGDLGGVVGRLDDAKERLDESGDPRQRAKILICESHVHWLRGCPNEAAACATAAFVIANEIDDMALMARCRFHQGLAAMAQGRLPAALELLERVSRSIAAGTRSEYLGVNLSLRANAESYIARSRMFMGDDAGSLAAMERSIASAEESNDIFALIISRISMGIVHLGCGRLEDSKRQFELALQFLSQVEARLMRPVFGANFGLMLICTGRLEDGRGLIETSIRESERIGLRFELGLRRFYLALAALVAGQAEVARRELEAAVAVSDTCCETGHREVIAAVRDRIAPRLEAGCTDGLVEELTASARFPPLRALESRFRDTRS